jgi:hypothetical protein
MSANWHALQQFGPSPPAPSPSTSRAHPLLVCGAVLTHPCVLGRTVCLTTLLLLSVQAFLDVYAVLRSELLSDKLLEGQPEAARDWLKEVSPLPAFATATWICCVRVDILCESGKRVRQESVGRLRRLVGLSLGCFVMLKGHVCCKLVPGLH